MIRSYFLGAQLVFAGTVQADVCRLCALVLGGASAEFGMLAVECAQVKFVPLRSSANFSKLVSGLGSGYEHEPGDPFKIVCKGLPMALLFE
mmetsp:Transcript_71171/g.180113  ORF Transcript_71171/g.180113 Transcript_71171/m.180113 type:complete len:91 (-) Transcript_71171:52-324(-)